ncbi:hypothetical protein NDU88_000692 [Pleurodeles waltl]|uniref:Uncharacterized protein n=1 Tax=Pleurodeles waltl TaxID=8319 RepID=A0AAV7WKF0_PLEWA|nr:hypothetical protein NDU88_000692 [Pleurodeles waltl]
MGVRALVKDRRRVRRSPGPAGAIWEWLGRAPVEEARGGLGMASMLEPEGLVAARRAAANCLGPQENAGQGPGQEWCYLRHIAAVCPPNKQNLIAMVKDKGLHSAQSNKIVNNTQSVPPFDKAGEGSEKDQRGQSEEQPVCTPLMAYSMEAITSIRAELATKKDSVVIEVNLLRADLCGVADRMTATESNVGELQQEVSTLGDTVSSLTKLTM